MGQEVEVECKISRETDAAMLVTSTDTGVQEWVPLSQVSKIVRRKDGLAEVTMAEWIANKKGLI